MHGERESGGGDESGTGDRSGAWSGAGARYPTARALLEALRRGEAAAFRAFVDRYHRLLLRYAQRAGLDGGAADELVQTVLDDAAIDFMRPDAVLPDDVAVNLIARFRNFLLNTKRADGRRERRTADAARLACDPDVGAEGDAVALCSEQALRARHGPAWEPLERSEGVIALATFLSRSMTDDERRLLAWESEDVPQREIADRLGVSHAAVRQRLRRLRERLRELSRRFAEEQEGENGRAARRLLRRASVLPAPRAAAVWERSPTPPRAGVTARDEKRTREDTSDE